MRTGYGNPFKHLGPGATKEPLQADVFIQDCPRQDHPQFGGQYVWTVKLKLWRGPTGYYPRLGDPQFDVTFDIPADWASDGWPVPMGSTFLFDTSMSLAREQALKAVDMNGNPLHSATWLIKKAVQHGILDPHDTPQLM